MPAASGDLVDHDANQYRLPDGPLLPWQLMDNGRKITVEPIPRLLLSINAIDTG
ncbi:hypothetical protein SAMN05444339_12316 [Loktanella atrilutea]|uniref:Uncharacterized protein n=1 Tax=Loktanella atrilutea TaxID=366533 RepID=A0A1M5FP95_LOKAT|nr:hypothetical protein SAMN05444339_12316 [Loktanella atrilutea]